jgi:hypothetical protein
MFEGWDDFYLLIGGAAGALIGLLFIVVTLIRGGEGGLQLRGASVFMTPTVAHLAMVLTLSALATAPKVSGPADGAIFLAGAVACLGFTGRAFIMLARGAVRSTHWSDLWGYGVAPFAASLVLAASAATTWVAPEWAARGIAFSVVAMLLIAVRNAWDLVTWITSKGGALGRDES